MSDWVEDHHGNCDHLPHLHFDMKISKSKVNFKHWI